MLRSSPGYRDGELFIARCEKALAEGDAAFLECAMPRLEGLIARLQERAYELAQLQYWARMVREKHEPSDGQRKRVRLT